MDLISTQRQGVKAGKRGAEDRLAAAEALPQKLALILGGEPDLNDGVRMNIRPFVEAGVFRKTPKIQWTKDRGKEPENPKGESPWFWKDRQFTGHRVNDVHLRNADKRAARQRTAGAR